MPLAPRTASDGIENARFVPFVDHPTSNPTKSLGQGQATISATSMDSISCPLPIGTKVSSQRKRNMKVPAVYLEEASISSVMAARLATSLISHVLFLKNQIPLPVVQLSKMSVRTETRTTKKRVELVNAIDTLSSHLHTTFAALSTAYCRRGTPSPNSAHNDYPESISAPIARGRRHGPPMQAHLAIVLGSSVGAAKAKVLFVVDGLEVKLWGAREDADNSYRDSLQEDEEQESEDNTSNSDGDENDNEEADSISEPPNSRSPSPSPPPQSRSPSPFRVYSQSASCPPTSPQTDLIHSAVPSISTSTTSSASARSALSEVRTNLPLSAPVRKSLEAKKRPSLSAPPVSSHQDIQKSLGAADRLLSRTLASNCAEDENGGLSSELAPTQTQIYLRAPRRFQHPAWIPKQNLTKSLETTLRTFLTESASSSSTSSSRKKGRIGGVKTEGVWLGCNVETLCDLESTSSNEGNAGEELAEDDEMIWWVWDGKLVGFSDW
ncbi:hypothetical protein C8Q75DRAFT_395331 [Abortiporus biennis]|nr:hypothetical protein C8Q75DRAFT_395331 [Abortiporus biennis]